MTSPMDKFLYALEDYAEEFGDTPTVTGLDPDMMEKATVIFERALDDGKAVSEADFRAELGLDPVLDDNLI